MLIRAVIVAAFAACVSLATSQPAFAQLDSQTGADESRIMFLENAWNSAVQQKNTKALDDLLSSYLVYTDPEGALMNKSEFLASVANPASRLEQIVNESVTVHSYGTVAVVAGVTRQKGILNGKSYSRRVRFTDTWVSQNGVWQCVASQSTLVLR